MIAAAAMPWKSACGRCAQLKTWIGRTVKPPSSGWGREVTNVAAPTTTSGAASPIARAMARMMPVMIPGAAAGRTEPRTICHWLAPSA